MNPQNPQQPDPTQYAQPAPQVAQPTMQQPMQPAAGAQPYMQQPMQPQAKSKLPLIIGIAVVVVVLAAGAALMLLGKKDEDKPVANKDTNATNNVTDDSKKSENNAVTPPKAGTTDSKVQDTKVRTQINSIHSKLEEYFNNNNGYPATFSTSDDSTFPGIDVANFTDPLGKKVNIVAPVADKKAADLIAAPLADGPLLQYIPYACKGSMCDKYILRGYIVNTDTYGANPFTKLSLN